jgi:hypothetical protein
MKNVFKNKSVSALVLLVVAISCGGILQYLWTKSKKNENALVVEVAAQDPEFDPDEQRRTGYGRHDLRWNISTEIARGIR